MLMRPSMPALLFALIHRSAWNRNSAKFAFWAFSKVGLRFTEFSEVRDVMPHSSNSKDHAIE
jgi:hypothetical protein